MKKIVSEILYSFKKQPLWTIYGIILTPFYYLSVVVTALLLGAINLSLDDFLEFIKENT